MKAMYWQGTGSAIALAYGDVNVGMSFVAGPQWPYQSGNYSSPFTAGVTYVVTGVNHQADLPVMAPGGSAAMTPTCFDSSAGLPNTTDSNGWVQFNQAMAGLIGAAGYWIPTVYLANALRVG